MKLYYIIITVLISSFVIAEDMGLEPGRRDSGNSRRPSSRADRLREQQEQAHEVFAASEQNLDHILEKVSSNQQLSDEKLEEISKEFLNARRNLRYLEDAEQSKLMLLDGWLTYFNEGDAEEALKRTERACMLNPTDGNAYASSVVFSILSGREPKSEEMVLRLARRSRDEEPPRMSGAKLDVDVPEFARIMINRKVPISSPQAGGSQDQYTCVLLWTLKPEPINTEDFEKLKAVKEQLAPDKRAVVDQLLERPQVSEDYIKEQVRGFEALYKHNTAPQKINFFSINVDESVVLNDFLESYRPEPMPVSAAGMPEFNREVKQALKMTGAFMLVIDGENTVKYAGGTDGFLPIMVLNDLVPGSQKERELESKKGGDDFAMPTMGMPSDMMMPEPAAKKAAADSNSLPDKEIVKAAEQEQPEELTDQQRAENTDKLRPEQKAEAENLLTKARMFRGSHTRLGSSRRVAESCFEVIEKFPGTTYEKEALEILDSVPEHQKKRYGIE